MRVDRITPETSRGKGWARVLFKECNNPSELASMAIVRPRHMEPYLGRMGWQISESRLPLSIQYTGESEFVLFLPPTIVQHLEVASNYEFCFFDSNIQKVNVVIVRWSGISYRAPRGEISPIEIIQSEELPSGPLIFGADKDYEDLPVHGSQINNEIISSSTNLGPAWGGEDSDSPLTPQETSISSSELFAKPDLSPQHQELPQEPFGSYERKLVQRVKCINPNCGAVILDSMNKCPFCGT